MEAGRILADRYELLAAIAEGASSTVWEARDTQSGHVVAVKAVSMERAGWRAEVRDRFEKEGRLLQLVDDPHLVGVRDRGETDDGYLYLVLERLTGETLADRLARPPRLTWKEAATIARDLACGLAALHERGIVHRDLKPANVILEPGPGELPTCKIIDLGISRASAAAADPVLFATLTATGQVLGTPEYMSYEQALGERDVDARTDVWALGAMLYEMLADRRPFEGEHPNAVLAAIRRGPPPPLDDAATDAPAALRAVVMACFEHRRDARPRDGAVLRDAIESAMNEPAAGPYLSTHARTRRSWLIVGGLAVAVLGAAMVLRSRGARPPVEPSVTTSTPAADLPSSPGPEPLPAVPVASQPTPEPSATAIEIAPLPSAAPTVKSARPITRVNSAGF